MFSKLRLFFFSYYDLEISRILNNKKEDGRSDKYLTTICSAIHSFTNFSLGLFLVSVNSLLV